MFEFLNLNKKNITTTFPKNYVDIHSHMLPNIDDGANNFDEAIFLLKRMRSYGIKNFILTPHVMEGVWENSSKKILLKLQELKEILKENKITDLNVKVAAEYMLDNNFIELLKTKDLLTLKEDKLLVEISYLNPPINLHNIIFDIQLAGYQPILAHPERYRFYHNNFNEYFNLKNLGCKFQLNLLSLSNYYGKNVQSIAFKLLKENMIDFVGSDVHNIGHLNYLEKKVSQKVINLVEPILKNNTTLL